MTNAADIRSRIIHPVCNQLTGNSKLVDKDAIIRNCILFNHFIIRSYGLEFPELIDIFGYDGFIDLLKSKIISFHFDIIFQGMKDLDKLPADVYNLILFKPSDTKEHISRCLENVNTINKISYKQKIKLKGIIADYSTTNTKDEMDEWIVAFHKDMENLSIIKRYITKYLSLTIGKVVEEKSINVDISRDINGYHIETNISDYAKLGKITDRHVVEKSIFGILAINRMILDMRKHNAIPAFKEEEISLYDDKLLTTAHSCFPDRPINNFNKVVSIANFPDFSDCTINVDKLMKIRESEECVLFRNWLWSTDVINDKEVITLISGLRNRIGIYINKPAAKVLRFLGTTGLSLGLNFACSTALSIVDSFVLDRIFPNKGLATFINDKLPSLFTANK